MSKDTVSVSKYSFPSPCWGVSCYARNLAQRAAFLLLPRSSGVRTRYSRTGFLLRRRRTNLLRPNNLLAMRLLSRDFQRREPHSTSLS